MVLERKSLKVAPDDTFREKKMKRITLILVTMMMTLASCNKEEPIVINDNNNNNNNGNGGQSSGLTINQISGVWTIPNKNVYFLSLNPNMHYSLCLRTERGVLIGSGTFALSNNKLTLYHDYFNTTETLNVSIVNGQLICQGNMIPIGETSVSSCSVHFVLNKTTESFSPSKAGYHFSLLPTFGPTGEYYDEYSFITNNTMVINTYKKQAGSWQLYKTKNYYYVYRTPYTYMVRINTLEIKVYNFEDPTITGEIPLP